MKEGAKGTPPKIKNQVPWRAKLAAPNDSDYDSTDSARKVVGQKSTFNALNIIGKYSFTSFWTYI